MTDVQKPFRATDRMRDILPANHALLLVLSRFDIPFGFGDSTVEDICRNASVHCPTFLAVANFICHRPVVDTDISLPALMDYLRQAHTYFLDFILPLIRRKLIEAINTSDTSDAAFLILKFYDDYVGEVRRHMEHENNSVFAYIDSLLNDTPPASSSQIERYRASHNNIVEKLKELKDIVIYHYRHENNHMLNYALYDINNCEDDLLSHCDVENKLFIPAAMKLERELAQRNVMASSRDKSEPTEPQGADKLSGREKEILVCVARGMSSKEIADALNLSVHTVTTYRRNIAAKLEIHSQAGLTIFAIIHNLIDIKDLKKTSDF